MTEDQIRDRARATDSDEAYIQQMINEGFLFCVHTTEEFGGECEDSQAKLRTERERVSKTYEHWLAMVQEYGIESNAFGEFQSDMGYQMGIELWFDGMRP